MKKERKTGQVPAGEKPSLTEKENQRKRESEKKLADQTLADHELTYEEAKFVEEYVCNGSNATQAALEAGFLSPRDTGSRLSMRLYIKEAIELEREKQRIFLQVDREKVLRTLMGQAFASLEDFTDLFDDPSKKSNYRKLGFKRFGVASAKRKVTYDDQGRETVTNEVTIISPGERRAALNDLWEKLGLGNTAPTGIGGNTVAGLLGKMRAAKR